MKKAFSLPAVTIAFADFSRAPFAMTAAVDSEKSEAGATLSRRACRSMPESADRFAAGPTSDRV